MTVPLAVVLLALVLPWGAAAAARRLASALPPREAAVAVTGAAVLLAGGTVAALVGLFHVPFLAGLERVPVSRVLAEWPAAVPVAAVAGAVLALQSVRVARRWFEHRRLVRDAWAATARAVPEGDLLVVPGSAPDAFALPGQHRRGGRVVVTQGMLRALGPAEREVLLAHERAHLAGHHHVLSVTAYLAAAVHPALRSLLPVLDFQLERWADEAAAATVGDRRLAATAIARAALAGSPGPRERGNRNPLLSVSTGPVPLRVEALLGPLPVRPGARPARAAVAGLVTAVVASALLAAGLAYGLHEYVEFAAGAIRGR
ncbi:M56 family metallopeptidase [Kitasatospora sp. NPDC057015]|uniref:M56 family metallopeptidase n=1 Tax=Kitasatospora sp. NPDC057015 TaxID=3346001 RepID=UPI00364395BF